jgi:hypothetical protein
MSEDAGIEIWTIAITGDPHDDVEWETDREKKTPAIEERREDFHAERHAGTWTPMDDSGPLERMTRQTHRGSRNAKVTASEAVTTVPPHPPPRGVSTICLAHSQRYLPEPHTIFWKLISYLNDWKNPRNIKWSESKRRRKSERNTELLDRAAFQLKTLGLRCAPVVESAAKKEAVKNE